MDAVEALLGGVMLQGAVVVMRCGDASGRLRTVEVDAEEGGDEV